MGIAVILVMVISVAVSWPLSVFVLQKYGLEFGKEQYDEIDRYCKEIGIEWFASAWDIESQLFLRQYKLRPTPKSLGHKSSTIQ
jgi:hypothetical protein